MPAPNCLQKSGRTQAEINRGRDQWHVVLLPARGHKLKTRTFFHTKRPPLDHSQTNRELRLSSSTTGHSPFSFDQLLAVCSAINVGFRRCLVSHERERAEGRCSHNPNTGRGGRHSGTEYGHLVNVSRGLCFLTAASLRAPHFRRHDSRLSYLSGCCCGCSGNSHRLGLSIFNFVERWCRAWSSVHQVSEVAPAPRSTVSSVCLRPSPVNTPFIFQKKIAQDGVKPLSGPSHPT